METDSKTILWPFVSSLEDGLAPHKADISAMIAHVRAQDTRIAELEQAIEEAPHEVMCERSEQMRAITDDGRLSPMAKCDCWKRDALQRKVDDETN